MKALTVGGAMLDTTGIIESDRIERIGLDAAALVKVGKQLTTASEIETRTWVL